MVNSLFHIQLRSMFRKLCFLFISSRTSTDTWITITLIERAKFSATKYSFFTLQNIPFSHYRLRSFKAFFISWVVIVHGRQKYFLYYIIAVTAETHYPPASCALIHYLVSIHVQNAPMHVDALIFSALKNSMAYLYLFSDKFMP